jgi:hypothetical protein
MHQRGRFLLFVIAVFTNALHGLRFHPQYDLWPDSYWLRSEPHFLYLSGSILTGRDDQYPQSIRLHCTEKRSNFVSAMPVKKVNLADKLSLK